jgi:hypothetical protein
MRARLVLFAALAASSLASLVSLSPDAETSVDDAPLTVATLRSLLRESEARTNMRIDELAENIAENIRGSEARTTKRIDALAESVLTPAVVENVELCARSMVLAAAVSVKGESISQCSAVPLPAPLAARVLGADGNASTFFLTSAHCFANVSGTARYFVGFSAAVQVRSTYACALLAQYLYTNTTTGAVAERAAGGVDLAVVRCLTSEPVPPPSLSSRPYLSSTRVALAGFSRGAYLDGAQNVQISDQGDMFYVALHTKYTRLSSSLQTPVPVAKSVEAQSAQQARGYTEDSLAPTAFTPVAEGAAPTGFVEMSPWEGMSGGAVIDMGCGLMGVTESRVVSAPGGTFVRLSPAVMQRVEGTMSSFFG